MRFLPFLLLLGLPFAAHAQVPASDQPGREAERFVVPPQPQAIPGGTRLSLPGTVAPDGAEAIELVVADIEIVGSTVYADSEIAALLSELVGRRVVLSAVYDLALKISAKYGADGYVLSRAIVPPQDLDPAHAVITIQVIEGYVDRVVWPDSLRQYRDFFSEYAATIAAERPANIETITRYLLLAGDLPGLDVGSRFEASAENTGASTLVVEVTEKPIDAEARIDNRGTEARGPWQYLVSGTMHNAFRMHETVTGTFAGAFDTRELAYAALGYRQVLNAEGLSAFANVSYSWGRPGTDALLALDFASRSLAADAGLHLPVVRGRERNLSLAALVFLSDNQGDMLAAPSSEDRLRGFRFKADFDAADSSGGITQLAGTFSQGIKGLGSTLNDNPLASRENGRVDFTKIEGRISRTQPLGNGFSLHGFAHGQYAFTPLLSPEECGYGGKDIGRAFDPSEITGDNCWSVSGELRFDLPETPLISSSQLYAFIDHGAVYRIAPAAGVATHQQGSSAGIGLRLGIDSHLSADISATKPLAGRDDDGWRYFLSARASY